MKQSVYIYIYIKYGGLMLFANLGLVGIHVNWMGSMWGFTRIFDGGIPL